MLKQLDELKRQALEQLSGIGDARELEMWRVRYLGKKSELTRVLRGLGTLPLDERKVLVTNVS